MSGDWGLFMRKKKPRNEGKEPGFNTSGHKIFAQATQENQAEKSAIPIFKNKWCDQSPIYQRCRRFGNEGVVLKGRRGTKKKNLG
jgi:hypothetical protein